MRHKNKTTTKPYQIVLGAGSTSNCLSDNRRRHLVSRLARHVRVELSDDIQQRALVRDLPPKPLQQQSHQTNKRLFWNLLRLVQARDTRSDVRNEHKSGHVVSVNLQRNSNETVSNVLGRKQP
jgi:hypothetical protein